MMENEIAMNADLASAEPLVLIEKLNPLDVATIKKYELQDSALVQRLGQALPEVGKILANQKKAGEQLFKVDIPLEKLMNAKGNPGKYRAIAVKDGKIAQQAKLVPVEAAQAGAAVANVMAVAAVAVGQYYMAEIDQQLHQIKDSLNKIQDFQEQEFKGKIRSLLKNVATLAKFSEEYVLNEKLTQWKLNDLSGYRKQATDLLEQVNGTLETYYETSRQLDFKTYQAMLFELYKLLSFQDVLLQILKEIARLEQVLLQGEVSISSSYHLYQSCLEEMNDRNKHIFTWQSHYSKHFKIDLDKGHRKQDGFLGVIADVAKEVDQTIDKVADAAKQADKNKVKAGLMIGFALAPVQALAVLGGGKLTGELHKQIAHVPLDKQFVRTIKEVNQLADRKVVHQIPAYQQQVQLLIEDEKVYYLAGHD